jgi:NAD(P)-dependent dehydrogenase (short-subunit alcohol dehydrogenase family)
MESLKDKVAIITGASSGIGQATAILFSKYGCKLAISGRNKERLDETVKKLHSNSSDDYVTFIGDIVDRNFQKQLVDGTIEKFGKLDILINNAGVFHFGNIFDTTEEDYDDMHNTNLKAKIFLTQLCVPHLIVTKGVIVNNASVSAIKGLTDVVTYGALKAGLCQFTKHCAFELASKGVRVNAICPGFVDTPLHHTERGLNNAFREGVKNAHPIGRFATSEEMANTIGYLASDMSSFSTGTILLADGGMAL